MTAKQLIGKINRLGSVIPNWVDQAIKSVENEIVDRNVAQMEELGKDSIGRSFGSYESDSYREQKAALGLESRFINLHFEGDFHSKMDIEVGGGGVRIWSNDEKNDLLVKEWGEEIFGLNKANMNWLFDHVYEYLFDKLRTYFV